MGKPSRRKKQVQPQKQPASPASTHSKTNNNTNVESKQTNVQQQQQQQPQRQRPRSMVLTRAGNIAASLIQFGSIWLVVAGLRQFASYAHDYISAYKQHNNDAPLAPIIVDTSVKGKIALVSSSSSSSMMHDIDSQGVMYSIPRETLQPFLEYPDPIGITEEMREEFHPVVIFPKIWVEEKEEEEEENEKENGEKESTKKKKKKKKVSNYQVADFTQSTGQAELISTEQFRRIHETNQKPKPNKENKNIPYGVGRYDEDRSGMYDTAMFLDESNTVDGYDGLRTIHIGLDLGGPVGTKVYAFEDGIVHSVGYNDQHGDYGNVVVVEHILEKKGEEEKKRVWALYGHLDGKSIKGKSAGKKVKKGQVLGRMGDVHENGGWIKPHVHFQLSTHPPETHDMPGVVSPADRPKALLDYPDPRIVLGKLY